MKAFESVPTALDAKKAATTDTEAAAKAKRAAVRQIAATLFSSGCGPFSVQSLRWALSRLGEVGAREPLRIAGELIDGILRMHDENFSRVFGHHAVTPTCFGQCRRPDGPLCSGIIDGVVISHAPNGTWIVEGQPFPPDRVAAERWARRTAALRTLAAELGISADHGDDETL